jgi:hypothetical protein
MRVVGVSVYLRTKGRPAARAAVLDGSWSAPVVHQKFELTSVHTDLATALADLSQSFDSHLSGLAADQVVIRRADFQKAAGATEGPKVRLMVEGALAAVAKRQVDVVSVQTGKDLGVQSPMGKKAALDSRAAEISDSDFAQAVAAALVPLP